MDVGRDVEVTDSGVFLTGESGEKAFLMEYDLEGQLQWIKTKAIPNGRVIGYRLSVEGNHLFVSGYYYNFSTSRDPYLFITKFDIEGQQMWNSTWNVEGGPVPNGIAVIGDGIYLAGIIKGTTGEREWDALFVKFNDLGVFQWSQRWGGPKHERAVNLVVDDDTVYVIGFTRSFGVGGADIFLLEYDLTGQLRFNSTWGGEGNETYPNIYVVDGTLYISGITDSFGKEGYTVLSDGSSRRTCNVFLMKVEGSFAEFKPEQKEVESESTKERGIPRFPYESVVLGLVILVLMLLTVQRRR